MRTLSLVGLMLMTALAGCAEEIDDTQETDTPHSTPETGNATAVPLVPVVAVLVGENATALENGTHAVPALANVTFDAGASEGNVTAYTWTFGNETATGAVVQFAFEAGNHTVLLDLAGDNQTAALEIPITATSAALAELSLVETTSFSFGKGPTTLVDGDCASEDHALTFPAGTETRRVSMSLDPNWAGVAVSISYHVYLFDGAGDQIFKESRSGGNTVFTADMEDLALPGGAYTARGEICGTFVPQGEFDLDGEADHYA